MSDFIKKHKEEWDQLEILLKKAKSSVRFLSVEELEDLDRLYRKTTVTLSQVSSRTNDAPLIRYLNDLTARAHSVIYLPPQRNTAGKIRHFFLTSFPLALAQNFKYITIAFLLFMVGGLAGYFLVLEDPINAHAIFPAGETRLPGSSREQLLSILRGGRDETGGEKAIFGSFLFTHNVKVGLLCLATGILAGIPCFWLLIYNGMVLGAFFAIHHNASIYIESWAWILPHGITEIGAILICGAVGLRLGAAVIAPGKYARAEKIVMIGKESVPIIYGISLMLIFAALVESYLRQSNLSDSGRFVFAGTTLVFWIVYISRGFMLLKSERAGKSKMIPGELT